MDNQEELIVNLEKARQMDEDAIGWLVREQYPSILRFLIYRTRNREDAEDLTSEVFVRMVGSIKNQTGHFQAWLFKIARNLLIDYYRKKDREKTSSLDEMEDGGVTISSNVKEMGLSMNEIKNMLNVLTQEQQEVVSLRFLSGYSLEETSQIMHRSIGAVKVLQFRAIVSLRENFGRELTGKNNA